MCTVSATYDQYRPIFPRPDTTYPNPYPFVPQVQPDEKKYTTAEVLELIDAFRNSIEAAKRVDEITGQPDCEDPDKADLEERVAEIERKLDELRDALGS